LLEAKKKMKLKLQILFFLITSSVFSQKVATAIDTTKNKIGAQFTLTLRTHVDTVSKVIFPKATSFGQLEVIRDYKIDTVKKGAQYELIKKYGLTQFDSGRYTIPKLRVKIGKNEVFSDSLLVEVANVGVDTLKQKMYDIKPIYEAPSDKSWIWKLLLGLLLLALIGGAIYWFIKKNQKKKVEEEVYKTPIEKATSLLNILEKKELWQKGEVKNYYSELTTIARTYIEETIEIPAMESTTAELIEALKQASKKKKMKLSQEAIQNLEGVLKQADLVKFAKVKPLDYEITDDRAKIEKSIIVIDTSIPKVVENEEAELLNELQRQNQIKILLEKKRKKRITWTIASVFILLFLITVGTIAFKGVSYVKDILFGNPTKELYEGEWITSQYGNPRVHIATPEVLKRTDISKAIPKEGLALIKEMQTFVGGGLLSDFRIMVSTFKYKQDSEIDLSKVLDGTSSFLASLGAQNIVIKQDDFTTGKGTAGKKGYGTFTQLNPLTKTSSKLYYEVLVFNQDGGLQQLVITHLEGDDYGSQIAERVIQSVEFKKAATNE
jgi:flagellar basal body-associated protein FliL